MTDKFMEAAQKKSLGGRTLSEIKTQAVLDERARVREELAKDEQNAEADQAKDERKRVQAITNLAEAKANPKLADWLAFQTNVSVTDARKILTADNPGTEPNASAAWIIDCYNRMKGRG
jgi:hypothetical protein